MGSSKLYGSLGEDGSLPKFNNIEESDKLARRGALFWRGAIITLGCLLCVALFSIKKSETLLKSTESLSSGASSPPNIIFVLADDMGYGSLSEQISPFLVSLRDSGVNIENYYAQQSCTPSRASMLTGRYPISIGWQAGTLSDNHNGGLGLNETTIADVLHTAGYTNYMLGKWNLGNSSPRYLPTARGFDFFLGFMNAFNYYWSKRDPAHTTFHDFMYSDKDCYYMYDGDDLKHYSTHLYRDWAVKWIREHDFSGSPMFMYLAFNAVHDPWADTESTHAAGIPASYLSLDTYSYIDRQFVGTVQKEYHKSLAILDMAVKDIYLAVEEAGVLDNTYFIFASDNGGCPESGGRNIGLRGQKGTLFDGGLRVESFVHSSLLPDDVKGTTFRGLFHVSDWLPTLANIAGIDYVAPAGSELDGYDQLPAITEGAEFPRTSLLYNFKWESVESDFFTNAPGAIRYNKYKLLHTYNASFAGGWFSQDDIYDNDDDLNSISTCSEASSEDGPYTFFLFDLEEDPSETTNLFTSTDPEIVAAKNTLYEMMKVYLHKGFAIAEGAASSEAKVVWEQNGNYVTPWIAAEDLSNSRRSAFEVSYPEQCGFYSDEL